MADEVPLSFEGDPYVWDMSQDLPPEVVGKLWTEVAHGLEKSQTVVWKSAVESLQTAERFLTVSEEARTFVEKYMPQIISILVEQVPSKIGSHERSCVQDSLRLATSIIAKDLDVQLRRKGQSHLLEVVTLVFNRKKNFYKGNKGNWNSHMSGLPEVRMGVIDLFLQLKGFTLLSTYMTERIGSPAFPDLDILHQVLTALGDIVPARCTTAEQAAAAKETEDAAIFVGRATMQFLRSCSGEQLKKIPVELLQTLQKDLSRIFDRLVSSRRESTYEYYEFWRGLILRLIKSPSLPLRLFGWQQMDDLLDACAEHRPPPRYFDISRAGCTFVNGKYSYIAATTSDGYAHNGIDFSYQRHIPETQKDGAGKKLTLFRCTMRSQQKWWFLSEADEEQPGTDRDIDYYQHKSKDQDEVVPPADGWITCRNAGLDPPPQLQPLGLMVPKGQEYNTLEHQLAEWAVTNDIVQIVLGDSVHREIVSRSTGLIKFLASMCHRDDGVDSPNNKPPNQYCLQVSDLLLAWKTCSRKTDAAVSVQIYQLLVSILPECPSSLAIPLLEAVQATLYQGKERAEYLSEVADFCAALAAANSSDAKAASTIDLDDDVRREVLEVLWAVLTHPDAATLKVYDTLKRYVTNELRVEPRGSEHREKYLAACVRTLTENSMIESGTLFDEAQALRIVKLTHFVLAACPREQAAKLVNVDRGALPKLLFSELTACLRRLHIGDHAKKTPPSDHTIVQNAAAADLLSDRLAILRYVFGVSDQIFISSNELRTLWDLCDSPRHREQLMIFVSGASRIEHTNRADPIDQSGPQPHNSVHAEDILSAVFTEETCMFAFLDLFCSDSISFHPLEEGAYKSFQLMFNRVRQSITHGQSARSAAIDTLWKVCLRTGNSGVAATAMKDLLSVYVTFGGENALVNGRSPDSMETEPVDNSFSRRVFECLETVKYGHRNGDSDAVLAVERCLRILNAAIGQWGLSNSVTASTLCRLTTHPENAPLHVILNCLPHGLRGQACYRKINVMVKRAQNNQNVQIQQTTGDRDVKSPTTLRFSLDVHPLETLLSIKRKTAAYCECPLHAVKPISVSGRLVGGGNRHLSGESMGPNPNTIPEDSVVDEMGVVQGCEIVFLIADRNQHQPPNQLSAKAVREQRARDLSDLFCDDGFAGKLFENLMDVLEWLPRPEEDDNMVDSRPSGTDIHKLVWDLLLAIPTNTGVASEVVTSAQADGDAMDVDAKPWHTLLDLKNFHRSVYVLLAIDALMEPAVEVLSSLPKDQRARLEVETIDAAFAFRRGFIKSSGFDAVVDFFASTDGHQGMSQSMARMGNAVALRILTCCLLGNGNLIRLQQGVPTTTLDEAGSQLMQSLSDAKGLLTSLTSMVVNDSGVSTSTIFDILKFLKMLFQSPTTATNFVSLPGGMPEKFLVSLLLWEETIDASRPNASANESFKIRKTTNELILTTPALADHALPWLTAAVSKIEVSSDSTFEFFDVLQRLVADESSTSRSKTTSLTELKKLAFEVCAKIASCPRPTSEAAIVDPCTGVLCGCLALLRVIIDNTKGSCLRDGTTLLLEQLKLLRWSDSVSPPNKGMFSTVSHPGSKIDADDMGLIDLMGVIFDGFLSPGGSSAEAICCDKPSRQRAFDVLTASARTCHGPEGYFALVSRINTLMTAAAPFLKHRWGQGASGVENQPRIGRNVSKYSGLRNQGCTCYMNSFLQQVFMMPELRKNMCLAPLPLSLRSSGSVVSSKGENLVGKMLSMQWENGLSYEAVVESFDKNTGMHTIRYSAVPVATVAGVNHLQVLPQDIERLPSMLPDEFVLSEGRPGKETGVFERLEDEPTRDDSGDRKDSETKQEVKESEDEAASRHLMEEVQRTFIHLDEGSRGRCFDPRALVEASACLKLEFDVWQQNDASEFATKLLDRLEISLKRWAPDHFRYLDHTFGLKQTKQKICKECGLKTNREEKLLNVDCQIRGKSDIHEALGSVTEVEIMEGDNQVFCDQCKKNTDTVLRTAISTLPNMLILSLKRFDLDFTTFETVKLNSRCAFGQTLNMKEYTLDGLEAAERENAVNGSDEMDTGTDDLATNHLVDEDYEYRLAGVLVHAGVAQGGHYYSFIKDRSPGSEEQWYRFDDEDVTSFDPSAIETECFGGKVKKETKWPNGQVHTVESEQYANALMLFYEKVKPTEPPPTNEAEEAKDQNPTLSDLTMASGYEAFEPDVKKSNVTHQWQAFLFDAELQSFLKGLLVLGGTFETETTTMKTGAPWKASVIQMLLTFFYDVLLYSNERPALGEWVRMLEQTVCLDKGCARAFLARLASKTKAVSANWLRTYLSDCPDPQARNAAVRIFSAAFQSCLEMESEQEALRKWSAAWGEQLAATDRHGALPCSLRGEWYRFEDPQSDDYSLIGTILSFVNVLIEASPRNWRYIPELNTFVRDLAKQGNDLLRSALIESLIPARLVCTIVKDQSPEILRVAFPGSSMASEVAETQIRPETHHSTQMMSMGGNHVMNSTDSNYNRGGASPQGFLTLFEALGCLLGIQGIVHAPLVVEVDDPVRCHHFTLNDHTISALRHIFHEWCAPNAAGMDKRDIETYLQKCGIDMINLPGQKIDEIMAKFPTAGGNHLSLEGFLAYYQDMAQTNERRVRLDIHTHGFRPDLTLRPDDTRLISVQGRDRVLTTVESVALDVTSKFGRKVPSLGKLADLGLPTFQFSVVATSTSEIAAEHLLATIVWQRDTGNLLIRTLRAINQAPAGWVGNEALSSAIMVLRVMASVPDESQIERINLMMKCTEGAAPNADYGIGLLVASRTFFAAHQTHNYPNEISYAYERYLSILKELLALQSVFRWMNENRSLWSFMERDLLEKPHQPQQNFRSDFSGRGNRNIPGVPVSQHEQSDSGGMLGMHDSEDDEDSRFEEMETYDHGPRKIIVEGAGASVVNGVYARDGFFERANKFSRRGEYGGKASDFFLFQCNVSNNTKHWYLSIVPEGQTAGTSNDKDFYSAPVNETCIEFPPLSGWTIAAEGLNPPPTLTYDEIAPMDDSNTHRIPGPGGWDRGDKGPRPQMHSYGNA